MNSYSVNSGDEAAVATTTTSTDGQASAPVHEVRKVQAPTKFTSRGQRRAAARREGKKSYSKSLGARLNYERVLQVHQKKNTAWDDVIQIRNATNVVLATTTCLLPFFHSKEIREHIVDAKYLTRISLAMVEEVSGLYERLKRNSALHETLSGHAPTMDDTFRAYEIYNEYLSILEVYDNGASRLFEMVVEQLQLAVGAFIEAVGEEAGRPVVDRINREVAAAMKKMETARSAIPQ